MLAAQTHIGSENSEVQMEQYIFKRRVDGVHIINLKKTWEKLMLAARAIACIENPADVFVVSSRPYGQRAVLKFARYIGATAIAGRYTPGKLIDFGCNLVNLLTPRSDSLSVIVKECQIYLNGEKRKFFVGSIFGRYCNRCAVNY